MDYIPESQYIDIILKSSPVVQVVIGILLLISLSAWTTILTKSSGLRRAARAANSFEERFWSGVELSVLYNQISNRKAHPTGMENIFEAGFKEFARLRRQSNIQPMAILEGAQRAMRVALSRESDELEQYLSFLASVGSTSPYIGLLGTVWGVMDAFMALGHQQNNISTVAPGIAEALITTAIGLIAAIPATLAYNSYSDRAERLLRRYDAFLEEFSSILQRQAHISSSQ